jgi:hypothetical protein
MSFSRPFRWYHSQVDPIWHGTFKAVRRGGCIRTPPLLLQQLPIVQTFTDEISVSFPLFTISFVLKTPFFPKEVRVDLHDFAVRKTYMSNEHNLPYLKNFSNIIAMCFLGFSLIGIPVGSPPPPPPPPQPWGNLTDTRIYPFPLPGEQNKILFIVAASLPPFPPPTLNKIEVCLCMARRLVYGFLHSELEFLKSLWGLGTEEE